MYYKLICGIFAIALSFTFAIYVHTEGNWITGLADTTSNSGIASLEIAFTNNLPAPNLSILLNSNKYYTDLNWSNISEAETYCIYYSDDLSLLKSISPGSIPSGVTQVCNITILNFTDPTANESLFRYYTVSAVNPVLENISEDIVGKCSHYLLGIDYGSNDHKRKNWIGRCMNSTMYAEDIAQNIPSDAGIRVIKLVRPDASTYAYSTHDKNFGNNFSILAGVGYEVEVSADAYYTEVGIPFDSLFTYNLYGFPFGTNDHKRKNWISIPYSTAPYDAERFLTEIPDSNGIRTIKLVRANSSTYAYSTHDKNFTNNFPMYVGVGYTAEVRNDSNYTLS